MKFAKLVAVVSIAVSVCYADNYRHDEMIMAVENVVADYQPQMQYLYDWRGTDEVDSVIRADVQLESWSFGCQYTSTYEENAMMFTVMGRDIDVYEKWAKGQNALEEEMCDDYQVFFNSTDVD